MTIKYVEITSTDGINWSLVGDAALPTAAIPVSVSDSGHWSMGRRVGIAHTYSWADSANGLSWTDMPLPIAMPGVSAMAWDDNGIGVGVGYHYGGAGTRPIIVRWEDGVLTAQSSPFDGYTIYSGQGDSIFIDPELYDVIWAEGLFVAGGRAVNEMTITPGPAWESPGYGDPYSANPDGSVTRVEQTFNDNGYLGHFTLERFGFIELTLTNCRTTNFGILAETCQPNYLGGYQSMSSPDQNPGLATRRFTSRLLTPGDYGIIIHPSSMPLPGFTVGRHSTVYFMAKTLMTSPDGINWTNRPNPWANVDSRFYPPQPQRVLKVRHGGGQFVAIGNSPGVTGGIGLQERYLMTSPSGTTWTKRNTGSLVEPFALAYSPTLDKWVVMGSYADNGFVTSTDGGVTWTFHSNPFSSMPTRQYPGDIVWSPNHNLFIMVGYASNYYYTTYVPPSPIPSGFVATSPDGVTWTRRTVPFDPTLVSNLNRVAVYGNRIVAVGEGSGPDLPVLDQYLRQRQRDFPVRQRQLTSVRQSSRLKGNTYL